MSEDTEGIAIALFSEILVADQLLRHRLDKVLPEGMEISHFSVLNHLAVTRDERTPAQLAKTFHVTRGAMTNTLSRLDTAGFIHMRPDWDDARRKLIAISSAGRMAREQAILSIAPMLSEVISTLGSDAVRSVLPVLRAMRLKLDNAY